MAGQKWEPFQGRKPKAIRKIRRPPKVGRITVAEACKAAAEVSEEREQMAFVNWLLMQGVFFYAINNGARTMGEAVKLKRLGLRKGICDICIPLPIAPYHGLYLELKRQSGGVVSKEQKACIEVLRKLGYKAEVARGCEEAIRIFQEYTQGST